MNLWIWMLLGGGLGVAMMKRAKSMLPDMTTREIHSLRQLIPNVMDKVLELRAILWDKYKIKMMIGNTARTTKEQEKELAEGRSAVSKSWHIVRRAIDIYLYDPDTGELDTKAENKELYTTFGKEAEALGFRWLGLGEIKGPTGLTFTDPYHIEYREGLTWSEAARQMRRKRESA